MITEDVRPADCGTPEQAIFEEEALKKGMEEPSAANRSATIRRIAREGEAKRSQKSKDSSCWDASEKDFAKQKAQAKDTGVADANSWKRARRFTPWRK